MRKCKFAWGFSLSLGLSALAGAAASEGAPRLDPWTDCQYAFYVDCMKHHNDHVRCHFETSQQVCFAAKRQPVGELFREFGTAE